MPDLETINRIVYGLAIAIHAAQADMEDHGIKQRLEREPVAVQEKYINGAREQLGLLPLESRLGGR